MSRIFHPVVGIMELSIQLKAAQIGMVMSNQPMNFAKFNPDADILLSATSRS
jgi:hypothetical protein